MNFIQTPRLNIGAQKIAVIVTFLLLLIVLPLYFFKVHQSNVDCTDFSVYYRSAQRAKSQNWAEIYSLKDGACPYRYAPPLIPLFRPLAELSPKQGQLLWYLVQYFCFGFGFFFIYKTGSIIPYCI